jgi:hypothetical protein
MNENHKLTLPVQELIRAHERILNFATDHKGLPEDDCEAVLFYARKLISDIEEHCVERNHKHDSLAKWAA